MDSIEVGVYIFDTPERGDWIKRISEYVEKLDLNSNGTADSHHITIKFKHIDKIDIEPTHIVLLACFIEYIHKQGYKVLLDFSNIEISRFFYDEVKIRDYFVGGQEYIEPKDNKILNLWRIVDNKAFGYSINTSEYLGNVYFKDYDTTALKVSLDEVYANIADHSKSYGIAYSYISYKPVSGKIYVAVCDFGLGIAKTLRAKYGKYTNDKEALRDSIEIGVSAMTNERNRGRGLNTIISSLSDNDILRLVSNRAVLVSSGGIGNIKVHNTDFDFKGSLVYFEISTSSFPIRELEDEIIIY